MHLGLIIGRISWSVGDVQRHMVKKFDFVDLQSYSRDCKLTCYVCGEKKGDFPSLQSGTSEQDTFHQNTSISYQDIPHRNTFCQITSQLDTSHHNISQQDTSQQDTDCDESSGCHGNSIAYILFTSGTTGTPKIVKVPHFSIVPNILDLRSRFNVTPDDVVFNAAPLTFDPSVVEVRPLLGMIPINTTPTCLVCFMRMDNNPFLSFNITHIFSVK